MIHDANTLAPDTLIQADVCIAGAGAAGITLARELLNSGLRVVVLESGDFTPATPTQNLYQGSVDADIDYNLTDTRLRYFGGTTNHWAGWCRPLDSEDFALRSWIPSSGWPVTRAELEPYYQRARRYCQIDAIDFDAQGIATAIGRPMLPLDPTRVETIVYLLSPPTRFGTEYRDALATAAETTVYLNANLLNVRLAGGGGSVAALECGTLSGVRFSVAADRYILALGGVENARILLASNGQEAAGVGNQNDLVGRFFMEHPQTATQWSAVILASDEIDWALYTSPWLHNGVQGRFGLRLAPELRIDRSLPGMGITLANTSEVQVAPFLGRLGLDRMRGLLRSTKAPRLLAVTIRAEQRSSAGNRVTLSAERDSLGGPRAHLFFRIGQSDRADMQRSLEILAAELGRAGLGRIWLPLAVNGELTTMLEGGAHHMGTTRMAATPASGVVDANCRVHGVQNLYVAGSSIFPTGGFSNPTLSIVAFAVRLADHLKGAA